MFYTDLGLDGAGTVETRKWLHLLQDRLSDSLSRAFSLNVTDC